MEFVNNNQTSEERRAKYKKLRDMGLPPHIARRLRDFRQSSIDARIKDYLVLADKD